jgi:hypothetical protein
MLCYVQSTHTMYFLDGDITNASWKAMDSASVGSLTQVNSDWNAISGVAKVLNKPIIPAQLNPTAGPSLTITGTYPNLTFSGTPQVNSDWNAVSGIAQVLNKPFIPAQLNPIAGTNMTITGAYPNLTFNSTATGGTQVSSDWNATTGVAQILNKPTITPQVNSDWNAVSGVARVLNKPIIPLQFNPIAGANMTITGTYPNVTFTSTGATGTTQVSSDWNATTGVAQILNKPTITAPINSDWNAVSGLARILNKPTIPAQLNAVAGTNMAITGTYPNLTFSSTATGTGTQVNSDWSAVSGPAQILNKPAITAPVNSDWNATTGLAQILNKPTITPQVNSDWNAVSGTALILNKPAIPAQVNLAAGPNMTVTGTYPNLTLSSTVTQVNSDWNAVSGVARVLNKPVIPAQLAPVAGTNMAITGTYPNLTFSNTMTQVNSDWNATSGTAQVLNKPTIPAQFSPVAGTNMTITGTYPNLTLNSNPVDTSKFILDQGLKSFGGLHWYDPYVRPSSSAAVTKLLVRDTLVAKAIFLYNGVYGNDMSISNDNNTRAWDFNYAIAKFSLKGPNGGTYTYTMPSHDGTLATLADIPTGGTGGTGGTCVVLPATAVPFANTDQTLTDDAANLNYNSATHTLSTTVASAQKVIVQHLVATGGTPSFTVAGPASGKVAVSVAGADGAMTLTVTVTTAFSGTLGSLTYASPWDTTPVVTCSNPVFNQPDLFANGTGISTITLAANLTVGTYFYNIISVQPQ